MGHVSVTSGCGLDRFGVGGKLCDLPGGEEQLRVRPYGGRLDGLAWRNDRSSALVPSKKWEAPTRQACTVMRPTSIVDDTPSVETISYQ